MDARVNVLKTLFFINKHAKGAFLRNGLYTTSLMTPKSIFIQILSKWVVQFLFCKNSKLTFWFLIKKGVIFKKISRVNMLDQKYIFGVNLVNISYVA